MAQRWKPDLILLDVMLPGLNGTEVLASLRRKSDVPVIMVTAMGDMPDRIGALRYGADDYVVKPYHPGEVVARVQAVLGVAQAGRRKTFCAGRGWRWMSLPSSRPSAIRGTCPYSRSYPDRVFASGYADARPVRPFRDSICWSAAFLRAKRLARGGYAYL
jgi:hypothetical protein